MNEREVAEGLRRADELARRKMTLRYSETDPVPVKAGPGRIVKGSLKRLAGDKQYDANTSVANAEGTMIEFKNVTRNVNGNGSGLIIGSKVCKCNTDIANVSFRIWLYQISFATGLNPATEDGDLLQIRWKRRDDRIGYLDFLDFTPGFDCAEAYAYVGLGQSILFSSTTNNIYGLVQTLTPYAALSEEELDFYLHIASD